MARWNPEPLRVRFWRKVDLSGDCWIWTASRSTAGYGHIRNDDGRLVVAHRVAYEQRFGPIPDGLVIDHLCRVRACVNPSHMEAVSNRENVLRGQSPNIVAHLTGRCAKGHPLHSVQRQNYCLLCRRERLAQT